MRSIDTAIKAAFWRQAKHVGAAGTSWRPRRVWRQTTIPTAPPRPCRWPGCPALVSEPGERFCERHRKEHKRQADREYDRRRPHSAERGYDANWRRLRRMILAERPLCVMCEAEGRVTPATDVDHIVPLSEGGTNDPSNLRPLCRAHHARRHLRDGKGRVWSR